MDLFIKGNPLLERAYNVFDVLRDAVTAQHGAADRLLSRH